MSWLESLKDTYPEDQLKAAATAEEKTRKGAEHLIACGHGTVEVLTAKARHFGVPFVLPERYEHSEEALSMVSEELMRRHRVLPLFCLDERLYVATADPLDLDTLEYLSKRVGLSVEPVVALGSEIERQLNRIFLSHARISQAIDLISLQAGMEVLPEEEEVEEETSEAPAVQMVERILAQGVHLGASDIHLEPYEKRVVLRYRVDGILRNYPPPPLAMYLALVSRIKIAANLNIAERRLPQDGRTQIILEGKPYDMRISIMPGIYGEAIVIRILSSSAVSTDLSALGFQPDILATWNHIITKPHGIVLVTGPTGSGKSTTLYSTLKTIATPERKIITLEDPVEYKMDGILQIPVNADIGYTFGLGLRSILRHDPDVVLLGEIRDLESAEIAIRASLTGHALLSTLHTNSAPQALTRLVDMGVQPYQVLASLNGVLAQRLVRKLCPKCKIPFDLSPEQRDALGIHLDAQLFGPRPGGCAACNDIGYRGRMGVHEVLQITSEIRGLDPRTFTLGMLIEKATEAGYRPLRHSAMRRLESGDTSLDEVLSVTAED